MATTTPVFTEMTLKLPVMKPTEGLLMNDPAPTQAAPIKLCISKIEKDRIEKSERGSLTTVATVHDALQQLGQKLPSKPKKKGATQDGVHDWVAHLLV